MEIRPCIYVMVALLLFNCIEMEWTEEKPVLDDDGKIITEAEIEANMGDGYRIGCGSVGGALLFFPALYWASIGVFFTGPICDVNGDGVNRCRFLVAVGSAIVIEVAAITISYYTGKHFDRRRTINHIKKQRREQKENAFGEKDVTDGFYFQLLKGTF